MTLFLEPRTGARDTRKNVHTPIIATRGLGISPFVVREVGFHFWFASPGLRPIGTVDAEDITSEGPRSIIVAPYVHPLSLYIEDLPRILRQSLSLVGE